MTKRLSLFTFIVCLALFNTAYAHDTHDQAAKGDKSMITGKEITYTIGDENFIGYYAVDSTIEGKVPGIIIVHEWWGHNDYVRNRAKQLAELGYAALALDMYGAGKLADHPKDAEAFMNAAVTKEGAINARFDKAIELLKAQSAVDQEQIAAIGYCFGGAVVLNMARAGKDLDAVVSFHGSLSSTMPIAADGFAGKVAVFNGADDPMVPADTVAAFESEMNIAGINYQLVNYPGVVHSFTNPGATAVGEKFGLPVKYDPQADADSWAKMQAVFNEVFE